jgi:protein O-GlcNAc transferase
MSKVAKLDGVLAECWQLIRSGQPDAAARRAAASTRKHPDVGPLWHVIGVARLLAGDALEAIAALQRAVRLLPENANAWDLLGVALQRSGRQAEAAEAFEASLARNAGVPSVWANAAANACDLRRYEQALTYSERALSANASLGNAWLARGNALVGLGREREALDALERAARCMPSSPEAISALGFVCARTGNHVRATELLSGLVRTHPEHVPAHTNLATVLLHQGRRDEAFERYRKALELSPRDSVTWTAYLFALTHADDIAPETVFEEHRRFGEALERDWRDSWGGWSNSRDADRTLRVGFVSGDLRDHAIAHFIDPVLEKLAGPEFDLYAYHASPFEDAVSERLRRHFVGWRQVHALGDDELFKAIQDDAIDLLIDLSGHTDYHRLSVFARKPAPVQLSWIGYPATTGLSAVDYHPVSLAGGDPGELQRYFVERLIFLPRSGVAFAPPEGLPEVEPLPALKNGHLTFASFARPSKISSSTLRLWARVLGEIPQARMLIGHVDEGPMREQFVARFRELGVDPARLDFRARVPMADYLQMHNEVDLILDTRPYGGGTTMMHAFWMGVPTLVVSGGEALSQRSGQGRLRSVGLEDFIAADEEAFVAIAKAHARDPATLAEIRKALRPRIQGLCSQYREGRELHHVLRSIWHRWCEGLPPETLDFTSFVSPVR